MLEFLEPARIIEKETIVYGDSTIIEGDSTSVIFTYKNSYDPDTTVNPSSVNILQLNTVTGEIFVCIDNEENANIWKSQFIIQYYEHTNPTIDTNPDTTGIIWLNLETGILQTCIDNTVDSNTWISSNKDVISESLLIYIKADYISGNALFNEIDNAQNRITLYGAYSIVTEDQNDYIDKWLYLSNNSTSSGERLTATTYLPSSNNYEMSFWFNLSSLSSTWTALVSNRSVSGGSSNNSFQFFYNTNVYDRIGFNQCWGSGSTDWEPIEIAGVYTLGTTCFMKVRNNNGNVNLYLYDYNMNLIGSNSTTYSHTMQKNSPNFKINNYDGAHGAVLKIADFRIYSY